MKVIPSAAQNGDEAYYVFRFRTREPHWSARDGWQAGVSGPFPSKGEPTALGGGDTFSRFDPWEGKTAEEHLQRILGITEDVAPVD